MNSLCLAGWADHHRWHGGFGECPVPGWRPRILDAPCLSVHVRPGRLVCGPTVANQRAGKLDIGLLSSKRCLVVWFLQSPVFPYCYWAVYGQKERVAFGQDGSTGKMKPLIVILGLFLICHCPFFLFFFFFLFVLFFVSRCFTFRRFTIIHFLCVLTYRTVTSSPSCSAVRRVTEDIFPWSWNLNCH